MEVQAARGDRHTMILPLRPAYARQMPAGETRLTSALASYGVIGAAADSDLLTIARLAARICGVPTATVNLLDEVEQHSVAPYGYAGGSVPREQSFCATTVQLREPVHVPDARLDARFAEHPQVTGELGTVRFYAGSQLRTTDGLTVGTLCVFDDVPRELDTGQREALDDLAVQVVQVLELRAKSALLADSNIELSRSNADLAHFAGRVAHDLRNPLAAISGFLCLARGPFGAELSGRARECVEHADAAVARMAALVNDLLAYATVGSSARSVDVDVSALARDVATDVQTLVAATDGVVRVEALPVVRTDPTLLRQLLQNFVTNGLKYSRPGVPPQVTVSGHADRNDWAVSVADNGRGIPVAERDRAFDPFVRLSAGMDVAGSGIGLATCARIADALGGSISVTDTANGGTTFTLTVQRAGSPT